MDILLIIFIIWYLLKYDFEIVKKYEGDIYRSGRFNKVFIYDQDWLIKQLHSYENYTINTLIYKYVNIPMLSKNGFGNKYILYCISILPKWISLENRMLFNYDFLPKIQYIDKSDLIYKEEFLKSLERYDCFYTKDRVLDITENSLKVFNDKLVSDNMVFIGINKKKMCITKDGKLKIIGGELLSEYKFNKLKSVINSCEKEYVFKNKLSNIYY